MISRWWNHVSGRLTSISPTSRINFLAGGILFTTAILLSTCHFQSPVGVYPTYRNLDVTTTLTLPTLPSAAPAQAATDGAKAPVSNLKIHGELALLMKKALLERAQARLSEIPDYSATFIRQERVCGSLLEKQSVEFKIRHCPLSVYMKWLNGEVGREVMYVEGQNDGRMLAKKGGNLGDIVPTVKLDPNGSLALAEARHPITEAGMLYAVKRSLECCDRDLQALEVVSCEFLSDEEIDSHLCHCIKTTYQTPAADKDYRCTFVYLDQETGLPLCLRNYGWPAECGVDPARAQEISDATLVEFYAYANLNYSKRLPKNEFEADNSKYRFRR